MDKIKVGDKVTVRIGWGSVQPGDVLEVVEINEYDDVLLEIHDRGHVSHRWTNNLNVIKVEQAQGEGEGE